MVAAGCSSADPAAESSASEAVSVTVEPVAESDGCAAAPTLQDALYGRDWLDAYRLDSSAVATLRRCHYSSTAQDRIDLVPPSSAITDGVEVQRIILSLPESTDVGHRCGPGGDFVYNFDEYTVLDQSETPVAAFQISENGPCGINNVVPSK